jgi:Tfp pilus assembly protein PilX
MSNTKLKPSFFAVAWRTLRSDRGVSLVVVLMLMVIILAMAGAGMLFSSIDLRASGNYRAGTQAFFAADTGVNAAYTQIGLDPTTSTALFSSAPITLPGGAIVKYCSGHAPPAVPNTGTNCSSPQPLDAPQVVNVAGFNLNLSNPSAVQFYQYKINVTGVNTQLSSVREVEAQVQYGPVPR